MGPNATAGYTYTDANNQTYVALRSVAIGTKSISRGSDSIAIGTNALSGGRMTGGLANGTIAIGSDSRATSTDSIAIGTGSNAYSGAGSVSIGANSQASGVSSTVFGNSAKALSVGGIAVGNSSNATGSTSLAIGVGATTNSYKGMAIGAGAVTGNIGTNDIAIGTNATVGDAVNSGTAIGNGAKVQAINGLAVGNATQVLGSNGLAMGNATQANGTNSISIGSGNIVNGNNSAAIGDPSTINGTGSYSIGNNNTINSDDVFVLGSNVKVNAGLNGSVVLGNNSTVEAPIGTASATIDGTTYLFAGSVPTAAVSVGATGAERTITHLAAGRVSAASTDAINGSQLFATDSAINRLSDRSVKYDADVNGVVNYNSASLGGSTYNSTTHTGGTKITNVAEGTAPSDAVNFSQLTETNDTVNNIYNTGTKYFHANSTGADSSATGTDAIAIGMGAVAGDARSIALGDGAKTDAVVATNEATILGTIYTFAGTAPVGTLSLGKAGEERTLTNLAAGRLSGDSTDGVNGSQLFATNSALKTISTEVSDLDARAVQYDVNTDGSVNYNNITLGGNAYDNSTHTGGTKITNVAEGTAPSDAVNFSQLTETNDTVNNIYNTGTKYFHANSTGTDSSATGKDSVAIGMGAVASHDNSIALGAGSVANGSTLGNAAYLVGGSATSEVNIGGRRITGVSAGAMDDDAVNVAQLKAVSNMASGTDERALKYDWNDKNGDGIVQPDEVDYSKATLAGNGGTVIGNLAAGEVSATSSEAINGSQLYNIAGDTSISYTTNNGSGVRYVRTNATGLPESDAYAKGQASTAVGYNATSSGAASVAIGQDSSASALSAIAIGKGAEADTDRSVALGDGAKTKTATGTSSVVIQGNEYAFAGTSPVGTVSVGDVGDERTITNVAAGELSSTSTDAVNGSQLYATVVAINNIQTGISDLGDAAVKYEKNGDGTTNYNKVVLGGGPTIITNLAAGTQDSDAVNYSQLKAVSEQVTNISNGTDGMFQVNNTSKLPKPSVTGKDAAAGGAGAVASGDNSLAMGTRARATGNNSVALGADSIADRDNSVSVGFAGAERQITNLAAGTQGTDAVNVNQLKSGISSANQYTDNKFNSLKNMVEDQGDKLSAGIAGAMAMSGLPQAYQPGASMVGIAGSTYQNQSAVALGVSMISDNGKWVTKLSGSTNSQGDLGGTVGVGYQW